MKTPQEFMARSAHLTRPDFLRELGAEIYELLGVSDAPPGPLRKTADVSDFAQLLFDLAEESQKRGSGKVFSMPPPPQERWG